MRKNSGYSLKQQCLKMYSQLRKRITINLSTLLRQIQHSISLMIQEWKYYLSNIELMYHILRHASCIPGLPKEYTQGFHHSGIKFRYTSDPLSCWVWWSQVWHRTHVPLKDQFRHAATHYCQMIPLHACLWTVYIHFALPLIDSFCSIPSIFSSFVNALNLWLPAHTEFHLSDTKLLGVGAAHPGLP